LATNVDLIFDARDPVDDDDLEATSDGLTQPSLSRYFRFDGTNSNDKVLGSYGSDYATLRLGNDTFLGFDGNDRLFGHGGADSLDGGAGDDLFEIGGFGTNVSGTTSKADDGKPEWIISAADSAATGITNGLTNAADYGSKADLIVGGTGYDTLRVTTGIGATNPATGTIILSDANFKRMEKVEVGGSVSKDADESTFQQLRDGHLYFARSGTVSDTATPAGGAAGNSINNVVINASRVTKNGLTFEGNANTQRFIGTTKADVFIGNEGADTLTGGGGADKFVFQTIREYARDSSTANGVIAYTAGDEALDATDADTITDFTTGSDKIVFRVEGTTTLEDTFDSLVALTKGNLTSTNVEIGDITASLDTAGSATSFIKADTTGSDIKVYYDADGNGSGAAVLVATLTNISTVGFSDFRVEAVQGF
jgi:Ca2+-binding RTX toxin-like protein